MNLTQLSGGAFALGLLALAGLLYALQRLRVRHREVVVPTTMFWREAVQEQRARTLVERFRHPWQYALLVLLAGLLWLGVARPDSVRASGMNHVLLLDASAGMAVEGRFEAALAALEDEVARSPRDRTEVLVCGEHVRTLLGRGEDRALLGERLEGVEPEPVPSSVERALLDRNHARPSGDLATRFVVIGDAPILGRFTANLGREFEGDRLERAKLGEREVDGAGIVALGVAPAASGDWTKVDVYVEAAGPDAKYLDPDALRASVDGNSLDWPAPGVGAILSHDSPRASRMLRDVDASGALLEISYDGARSGAADARASIRLPDRPRIRVQLTAPGAEGTALLAVLEADPAVELVSASPDVVVGAAAGDVPALALAPAAQQEEAILIGHAADEDPLAVATRAVGELALDRVDAAGLAQALGRTISLGAAPTEARQVSLWSELLEDDAGFVKSRAFPVVVGRAVRWLADVEPITPYRAVGRPVPSRVGETTTSLVLAAVGDEGTSLLDPISTTPGAYAGAELDASSPEGPGPWRPYTWFLLLALALLGVEWALHQRGRVA